jgi:hypothetical protein
LNRFKEQSSEFYPEFELGEATSFDPESIEPGLADWEWGEAARPPARPCPPFQLVCDCPLLFLDCQRRRKELCNRILGAIILAKNAAFELEAKVLGQATVNKFRRIFGQNPSDRWEIPGMPRRTAQAGDIVANRFRTIEKELQTRDTLYRCLCDHSSLSPGGEESPHPTETIVRDPTAWAVLCKNEVRLCPPFWSKPPKWQEGTILHEMLHLCFGLTCAWFQHDRAEKKRNNAYCYEAFAVGPATEPITITKCDSSPK